MNVVLGSMFRDATGYLSTYFEQVEGLRTLLEDRGDRLRVVAVENDSRDDTHEVIDRWLFGHFADGVLIRAHDDCPYHPSVDIPERWRHHAWVANHVLEDLTDEDDVIVYVESDLIWDPVEMLALIDHTKDNKAWTASVFHRQRGARWYDSWGTTLDGEPFHGMGPYHAAWGPETIRVDTCASVLACPVGLAQVTRFQPEDAFKGWCRDLYAHGTQVWLDTRLAVIHP